MISILKFNNILYLYYLHKILDIDFYYIILKSFIIIPSNQKFVSVLYFIDSISRYPRNSIRFSIFEIEYVTPLVYTHEMHPNLVTQKILSIMIAR